MVMASGDGDGDCGGGGGGDGGDYLVTSGDDISWWW